jgi:hypothetical protein
MVSHRRLAPPQAWCPRLQSRLALAAVATYSYAFAFASFVTPPTSACALLRSPGPSSNASHPSVILACVTPSRWASPAGCPVFCSVLAPHRRAEPRRKRRASRLTQQTQAFTGYIARDRPCEAISWMHTPAKPGQYFSASTSRAPRPRSARQATTWHCTQLASAAMSILAL